MHLRKIFILFSLFFCIGETKAQKAPINWNKSYVWVDSIMNKLSLDQKIAQLMMIDMWPGRDSGHYADVLCQVEQLGVGGLIFFKGSPYKQATLCNYFQSHAPVPLLIGIDGEWGLSMRLDSVPVFPHEMVLGAANDIDLTRRYGEEIGKQCRRIGIQLNFAPDADINNNMLNPVINDRSFGENKYVVARHSQAYAEGMQNNGVLACAKHFPGHGDTETDSHFNLPMIKGNRHRLDSLELYPFKHLIKHDIASIMVAHLNVPALDSNPNIATSLSPRVVKGFLKDELGFEGLIITDALNMNAVSEKYKPGEVSAMALAAGNDMLLFVADVPQSIAMIKDYIRQSKITIDQIDKSCRKILLAKHWADLNFNRYISTDYLTQDLNCCETELFTRQVVRKACVVVRNQDQMIPLQNEKEHKVASLAVGVSGFTPFQKYLHDYTRCDYFSIDKNASLAMFDSIFEEMQHYHEIIISIHGTYRSVSKKFGLTNNEIEFIKRLLRSRKSLLVIHGNPYILQHFRDCRNIVLAFEDLPEYQAISAQIIAGASAASGTLPVSIKPEFELGVGIETTKSGCLERIMPEEINVDRVNFSSIDSIAAEAIRAQATPGCQVLIASKNKVVYQKSFGHFTYDSTSSEVENHSVYDLASLTKIMGTTLAIMKLVEEKKIKLKDKLSFYLPFLKGTNKEKILIQDVLLHQAGLIPFIPFYKKTITNDSIRNTYFSQVKTELFSVKVADSLYTKASIENEIFETIAASDLGEKGKYVYSDLGFILLRKLVENVTNKTFERYLNEQFYWPLQLSSMGFKPSQRLPKNWIAPTEYDSVFRRQLVHASVHDQAAALLGGVSGHAGLFANASDVAVIMQMLLNKGSYNGKTYFKSSTIDLFTRRFEKKGSRRGLGFDKPETDLNKVSPCGLQCTPSTFGHTGFTGTCTWADPDKELVFVFLSNRIHPDAENKKLSNINIRTRMQDAAYEALKKK